MSNLLRTVSAGARYPYRYVVNTSRNFSRTLPRSEKPTVPSEAVTEQNATSLHQKMTYVVKPYQKYALVWSGTYKSVADVPERVSHGVIDSALNKVRVKIAVYMMIATALLAGAAVYSGKKAAQRGDSLAVRGLAYHAKLHEEAAKEKEAAIAKSAQ
ncbi:UPF0389 protein CG9231 isoform X2 [Zootermopsis nevadensis]|uniref:UPF0389 protein CG9231 isoform X2 n=1 Tax=Zootermopsis nevadensis TaxID=136037 RepID=UPI000B8EC4F9|nr:UPF0389 protein CG9231 isoform X2 [Zootermopsis nevadensis]